MGKIDFVLPWVDGDEPKWKEIRKQYKTIDTNKVDANSNARFRDMETLKYTLRAIEQNCPWYNKIYLITKGYCPEWLNIDHEKIELIREDELFIDKSHLPVFSSVAIEMNLVNLKNLSEKFVYMNDDFIIFNKIKPSRFFVDDKPVDFLSHNVIPRNKLFEIIKRRDTWIHSINNVLKLFNTKFAPVQLENQYLYHKSYSTLDKFNNFFLQKIFKKFIWLNHWHHPQPLLKQTLKDVYDEFSVEMMECSKNRFRSNSDLNQYMYRYWQLAKGEFYPYKHNDDLIANITSFSVLEKMIDTLNTNKNINFVCFNDSTDLSDEEYYKVKTALSDYLEKHFPDKASFEY